MEERGWYITSKLVQVKADQIASRVINRSLGSVRKKFTSPRVIITSSASETLCSVTGQT